MTLADLAGRTAAISAAPKRDEPRALTGLRQVATTPRAPDLPFVTARTTSRSVVALRDARRDA